MIPLSVLFGLTIGNFIYQYYFGGSDWSAAIRISYFQAISIGAVSVFKYLLEE